MFQPRPTDDFQPGDLNAAMSRPRLDAVRKESPVSVPECVTLVGKAKRTRSVYTRMRSTRVSFKINRVLTVQSVKCVSYRIVEWIVL